ncbi:MAG: GNAT family N-acetyltransferase [Lachnospiraceae bacterium]|nr:GNAT family N-acetyltransferase [Lachnospiraceae bacterium]
MKDYKILAAGKEQADIVAPFIGAGAADALKEGIPLTVLAAVDGSSVTGVLAGMMDGQEFIIDSVFVDPEKRRTGAGTALMEKLDSLFPEGNIAIRAEFNIENEDNGILEQFLTKTGFEEEEADYPIYYLGFVDDLISENIKKADNTDVRGFSEAGDMLLRAASNESVNEGRPLPDKGLMSASLDRESSSCLIRDSRVVSYVAVEVMDDETIKIPALYSAAEDPRETLFMLNRTVDALKSKYSPDTKIVMLALNRVSEKIISHMFGDVTAISRSFVKFL